MNSVKLSKFFFSTLLLLLLAACIQHQPTQKISPQTPSSTVEQQTKDFSAQALNNPPAQHWLTNGGSLSNQRWSPLKQINRSNVAQLKGVWRTHLNGSGMGPRYSGEAQPLVYNGVVYIVTGEDDVFAVSVTSGEILWQYDALLPNSLGRSICCGWTSRGLGLGPSMIFVGQLDGKLLALDQSTGEVLWQTQAMRWQEGYSITSAPLYYDNMVITGFAGGEYGVRGLVKAFDANTGELLWSFHTVPAPGEPGHESWPQNNDAWKHGGATVWHTPAVDPEQNLLYFSTGNPGPDYNGSVRAGDNLYANSIIAVDAHTGEYRWHFQQVHHDIWDYDASNPVILFDTVIDGSPRKALAQAGKTGWIYILDRLTGEPLLGIEERPVLQNINQLTAATQPYVIGDSFVPQFVDVAPEGINLINQGRIFTPFDKDQSVLIQPSPAGSANWPPSAYDPSRNMMFVCATESAMVLTGSDTDLQIPENLDGNMYIGGNFGTTARPQTGMISAMNMTTNTLAWQYRWQESCYSGFVASAGDLLFVGRNDGRLTALDIDTGQQLWQFQTGAGMNATVSIFEDGGQQYIVAYAAGNVFAGSTHGDNLWLFALDGRLEEDIKNPSPFLLPNTSSATSNQQNTASVFDSSANIENGKRIYSYTCLACHGENGIGGHGGGPALNTQKTLTELVTIISIGQNTMPGFFDTLTTQQINDVSVYILEGLPK